MTTSVWEGEKVRLRPIRSNDWEKFHLDGLDSEINRLNDQIYGPRSEEGTQRWAEEESKKGWDGHDVRLAIETLDGDLVGSINPYDCDSRNGTFKYGISIFRDYWKKGYAKDAIQIVLRYYFGELRYQKVNANVYAFNEGSIKLHQSLGFSEEGRLRNMIYTNGSHHDLLLYGLTNYEYQV